MSSPIIGVTGKSELEEVRGEVMAEFVSHNVGLQCRVRAVGGHVN